jgi:hypothetical protein
MHNGRRPDGDNVFGQLEDIETRQVKIGREFNSRPDFVHGEHLGVCT